MNIALTLASVYVPGSLKRRKLAELLRRTVSAFEAEAPDLTGKRFDECLRIFAVFTNDQAERALRTGAPVSALRARLRGEARAFAEGIRSALRISSRREAMQAARLLYRILGIDFEGNAAGAIVIRKCYFSGIYSPRTCDLMSSLDEGMLAGLAGEGRLAFASRITEGCDRCTAAFRFETDAP